MRRRTFLGLAAALGACLAGAGCAPAPSEGGPSGGPGFDTSRTALCVLETRENIAASRVIFYDGALAELGELRLPYAGLGGSWELPVVHGGVLFVIPEGYQGRKDERKALEIDLSTLGVRVHRIDRVGMYGIAANDDYVYACSNLNGSSYVSRCSRSGGEVVEAEERGVCVDSIVLCKDRLCAFATDIAAPDDRPWLYAYDLDLSLVERVDLSAFGKHQYRPLPWGGRVYFPSWSGTSEDAESQALGSYDPATGATEAFDLGRQVLEVVPWGERLVALFGDVHDDANGKTTSAAVCEATERWRPGEVVDLGYAFDHAVVRGDTLYTQSDRTLRTYDLTRGWEVQASAEISHIDGRFSCISGMVSAKG